MIHHSRISSGTVKPSTVVLYEFDGQTPVDSSRNQFIPAVSGTVAYVGSQVQGRYGTQDFNSGYLFLPSTSYSSFQSLANWTIQFWAKVPAAGPNQYIFNVANTLNTVSDMSCILFDGGNDSYWGRSIGGSAGLGLKYTSSALYANGWHHFAFVAGTNSRKLFVDNVLVASDAGNSPFSATIPSFVGIGKFASVATQCASSIDQFRFSNRALPGPFPTTD